MKHLAIAAAALLLFAAPGFAQNNDSGNTTGSTNETGAAGGHGGGGDCPAYDPSGQVGTFSESCLRQIDAWVNEQTAAGVVYEGDVAVGTVLPESVEVIEVPAYRGYGYARLNDRRVLIDRSNRTIVRVF